MNLTNNKILITGGASGIGLGLTERFLQLNNQVIICGRRADVLDKVQTQYPTVITRVCDLAIESERIALFQWISEEHNDVNVLINNAGVQNWMKPTDDNFYEKAMMEININNMAPIHLTHLFLQLPSLKTIINVTSGLAFVQLTAVPVYCATKSFFHSFTLSLRHLMKAKNVEVIEIIPPALNTNLGGIGLHDEHPPVSAFIDSIFNQLESGKDTLTFGFSEALANAGPEVIKGTFDRMNG